jgi:hypothetical protein
MLPESLAVVRDDVVLRYRSLMGVEPPQPAPSFEEAAGLLSADFRRFFLCRAGGFATWARFALVVNDDLIAPLEALVTETAKLLSRWGIPAGWRGDDDARVLVDRARRRADDIRFCLGDEKVETALEVLVTAFHELSPHVGGPGPRPPALRDSLRRLLPLLGCVAPATTARAWSILGLRGRPTERFADGSLVDEPAPPRPSEPLFPSGPLDPRLAATWAVS